MKKVLIFVMAVIILTTMVFTGCGKSDDNKAAESAVSSQASAIAAETKETVKQPNTKGWQLSDTGTLGTLPIADPAGSKTLKITTRENWDTSKSLSQPLPVWEEIEKRTGVKIEFEVLATAQYAETMKVRLAAGSGLPDIFLDPTGDLVKLANDKLVVPMNELVDKYAPNTKKFLGDFPELENMMKCPDGSIYGLAIVSSGSLVAQPRPWIMRKDWLDKLGLKEPETIDEWYNVLKAFSENDMNGNGKKDEIPLAIELGLSDSLTFSNAWGLHLGTYGEGYFPDADGKIQCEFYDPRAKEVFAFLNKLFKEGLLDPDFLNTKGFQGLVEKINTNQVGASQAFVTNLATWENALKDAGVSDASWVSVIPPSLNKGEKSYYMISGPFSGFYCISKDCKDTETAMKWFDYVYASEEGNRFQTWGIEGVSYVLKDGKPEYTDFVIKNPEGKSAFIALCSLGAMTTAMPTIRAASGPLSGQAEALNAKNPALLSLADKVKAYLVSGSNYYFPTAEESASIADIGKKGLDTYRTEMVAKFITGDESLDKYDAFVEKLKSLGSDDYVKILQDQLDRSKK